MKVTPLAAETLGVRSMAVFVETADLKLVIDPGVSLAPKRYGLEPSRAELAMEKNLWKSIKAHAGKADALAVSHYHYDHHDPGAPDIFKGKTALLKHPGENINQSQKGRAAEFLRALEGKPSSVEYADGRTFELGKTSITFSGAVPHGTDTRLGYVIQTAVHQGKQTFLHTSDVEGPSLDSQLNFILESQPTSVACDGPMTYLMYKYGNKALERSLANLARMITETPLKTLMLDHHLARDLKWRERMAPVFQVGEEHGCLVTTFAGYMGREDELLEARRKEIVSHERDK